MSRAAADSSEETELEREARRIRKATADLGTPLRLPHRLIGCRISVYWAGDKAWYCATVMKVDFVNNAVLLKYDDNTSADETQWEWEPALSKTMKILDTSGGAVGAPEAKTSAGAEAAEADAGAEKGGEGLALNLSRLTPFNEQCIGRMVAVYWEKHGLWCE